MAVAPTATLSDPEATPGDLFGLSAGVSVSGTTVVIGAPGANSVGAVYIYVKGRTGWSTTPTTTLSDPAATEGDEFGVAVAVSRWSALTAVVGAIGTNSDAGAAYIYVKGASGWSTTPTTTLSDPAATAGDEFGESVAVAGRTAVVGAIGTNASTGAAYVYVNQASDWPSTPTETMSDPAATAGDYFGYSVAVAKGGPTVVVGAPFTDSNTGAAYIYVNGASGWPTAPTTTLSDPAATAGRRVRRLSVGTRKDRNCRRSSDKFGHRGGLYLHERHVGLADSSNNHTF